MLSHPEREEVHRHSVRLTSVILREPDPVARQVAPPVIDHNDASPVVAAEEIGVTEELTRKLIFRFWNLTASQRRDIALRLKLITEEEISLPEPERYGRALKKARELQLLDQVAAEIDDAERQRS